MPFVTVTSKGGPYDDESYTAGWEMGALDRDLRLAALLGSDTSATIRSDNLPQAELIAMAHGYLTTHEIDDETPSWALLHLTFEGNEL
jgi:hypothetical protein